MVFGSDGWYFLFRIRVSRTQQKKDKKLGIFSTQKTGNKYAKHGSARFFTLFLPYPKILSFLFNGKN
jgi:hypothetical protein